MVTLGASASLRLAEGSKAVDFTKALPFPLGWSVDVAI